MKLKLLVSALVVLGVMVSTGTSAPPQDEKDGDIAKKMMEMMALCEKMATPGEQHAGLAKLAGEWQQHATFTMPGSPPCESHGTVKYRAILGGRFVVGESSGTMSMPGPDGNKMEKSFAGFNLMGYDNVLKQYQSVWCDEMGSGIFMLTGAADASGKKITYDGTAKDAMTPQGRPWRMVINMESDDKHTIDLWESFADGKTLTQMGTITSTRKK